MKSGFVAIVGKPNSGKSTLINKILGTKVSIVSSKAQTTRNSIVGVYNDNDLQIVFVDTPGIHDAKSSLGSYMNKLSFNEANGCDVIYYLCDCTKGLDRSDKEILSKIFTYDIPVFLILTKIDLCKKTSIMERLNYATTNYNFKEYIPISALKNDNIDELLKTTFNYLNEGPKYYPEDFKTNMSINQKISEIIRERVLKNVDKEIPHLVAVSIDTLKESDTKLTIEATITVNKKSHKGIIVGKNGDMLSKINYESTSELENEFNKKVALSLFVRVEEDWVNNEKKMFELGYFIDKNDK